jgi:hypothetical protein
MLFYTLNYPMAFYVVPIPPTLPLFATGLGMMVLFGWSRRRKPQHRARAV